MNVFSHYCLTFSANDCVFSLNEQQKVYLVKPKFRYEDLRSLSEVFEQGFWFFTWDLK